MTATTYATIDNTSTVTALHRAVTDGAAQTCKQMTSTDIRIELRDLGSTAQERDAIVEVRPDETPAAALQSYRLFVAAQRNIYAA